MNAHITRVGEGSKIVVSKLKGGKGEHFAIELHRYVKANEGGKEEDIAVKLDVLANEIGSF